MLIAAKDLYRQQKSQQTQQTLKVSLKVEEIYTWVEYAFQKVASNPEMMVNCFSKAGFAEEILYQDCLLEDKSIFLVSLTHYS